MSRILAALKTQPDRPPLSDDPSVIARAFHYWRLRTLALTIVGYALYYFVRTNISVPLKAMGADLGYSKERLGIILTVGGVTYGISKFVNGFLGDHANPRTFMALGLLACAAMNVCFGLSAALPFFVGFWFLNNWGQGMGFPPCAKSMAHWFSPRERASTFGVWHTSHMIGAALVSALTGYLVQYAGWRSCFIVPAALATFGAILLLLFLRDTPTSLGLPSIEAWEMRKKHGFPVVIPGDSVTPVAEPTIAPVSAVPVADEMPYWDVVVKYIFLNPYMWIISFANLATYVLRYAQVTWGPTFLQEAKGLSVVTSGWLAFGSEIGGMFGALVAGFLADRVFGGRAGRVCAIAMALMAVAIYAFWTVPARLPFVAGGLFVIMGFLLYVPQMLIAAMAMNLGTKRASAAAVGLTGIIGYASTVITGWGIGHLVDRHGWPAAFQLMIACALITLVLMALTWNVGAHADLDDAQDADLPASPVAPMAVAQPS